MILKNILRLALMTIIFIVPLTHFQAVAQEGSMSDGYVFLKAVKNKDYSKVKNYLQKGTNVNTRSYDDGVTALYLAATMKDTIMTTFLLDKKANADIPKRSTGETPLMVSVRLKSSKIIAMLVSQNCDVNISDRHGETALYKAIRSNNRDAVKTLLKANADWSIADNTGRTPLDLAKEDRRLKQMIGLLEDAGAEY
jgi:uncharacterized protein